MTPLRLAVRWIAQGAALASTLALALPASLEGAEDPAAHCVARKQAAVGRFATCLGRAHARATLGRPERIARCRTRLEVAFARAEQAAEQGGFACGSSGGTPDLTRLEAAFGNVLDSFVGPRFLDNGDGTVTDRATGRMWEQKEPNDGVKDPNDPRDPDNAYTWNEAYTEFLPSLNGRISVFGETPGLGGHADWRLPTLGELLTILAPGCEDYTGLMGCTDPVFGGTPPHDTWTSSRYPEVDPILHPSRAWTVNFCPPGSTELHSINPTIHVRAVRRVW